MRRTHARTHLPAARRLQELRPPPERLGMGWPLLQQRIQRLVTGREWSLQGCEHSEYACWTLQRDAQAGVARRQVTYAPTPPPPMQLRACMAASTDPRAACACACAIIKSQSAAPSHSACCAALAAARAPRQSPADAAESAAARSDLKPASPAFMKINWLPVIRCCNCHGVWARGMAFPAVGTNEATAIR